MDTTLDLIDTGPIGKIILVIIIGIMLIVCGTTLSHAVTKHGESAIRVNDCMDNQGPIQEWFNASNNHTIYICEVEPGLFGLDVLAKIDGRWERVTSFIKEKLKTLADVERYMKNSGAVRVR